MILDGGQTEVGIESTVLSIVGEPVLLRPGMISREQIEAVIGPVRVAGVGAAEGGHASPGMHARHYSPGTKLVLVVPGESLPAGSGAYMFLTAPRLSCKAVPMPSDAENYAAALYGTLFELDAEGHDWIAVELPPDSPAWVAIRDRLSRAAAR
jgi:L-threonylcarbamoyladenylate synthase